MQIKDGMSIGVQSGNVGRKVLHPSKEKPQVLLERKDMTPKQKAIFRRRQALAEDD